MTNLEQIVIKDLASYEEALSANNLKVFKNKIFLNMIADLKRCLYQHKRFIMIGSGKTLPLAIMLDASWRKFWIKMTNLLPDRKDEFSKNANVSFSIISGGDSAIIKKINSFNQNDLLAIKQIEDEMINESNTCLFLASDGFSKFVNVACLKACKQGAYTYYLFSNDKDKLLNDEYAKKILNNKLIVKMQVSLRANNDLLDLASYLVIASALENVCSQWLKENLTNEEYQVVMDNGLASLDLLDYPKQASGLAKSLAKDKGLAGLCEFVSRNIKLYEENGRITFSTYDYLIDVLGEANAFIDKNNLLDFRKRIGSKENSSVFVKNPLFPSGVSWQHVFWRSVKGLDYNKNTNKVLNINTDLYTSELFEYSIGYEDDQTRYESCLSSLVFLDVNDDASIKEIDWFNNNSSHFSSAYALRIGNLGRSKVTKNDLLIPIKHTCTSLNTISHVLIMLVLEICFKMCK